VRDWAVPVDLPELRAFLGLVGYYRQYIPDFAGIAQPPNWLAAKGVRWLWTYAEQQAVDHLKDRLVKVPILAHLGSCAFSETSVHYKYAAPPTTNY